jgi:hypothetical protein
MEQQAEDVSSADLNDYTTVPKWWQSGNGGDFFPTYGSLQWFIKNHGEELVELDALIRRAGRAV